MRHGPRLPPLGRLLLRGRHLPRPALLVAEEFLANCDRWVDRSTFARDALDLLVMSAHWGPIPAQALEVASGAYGPAIPAAFERATRALADDPAYLNRCFEALSVSPEAQAVVRAQLGRIGV